MQTGVFYRESYYVVLDQSFKALRHDEDDCFRAIVSSVDAGDIFGSDMIVVALKYGSSQGGVIDVCDVGKHIP